MTTHDITDWFYQYNKDIYHFLIYYTASGDVEDLVQEVFIRAITAMDTFKEDSSPKTWLISIARHVAIDANRKKKRTRLKEMLTIDNVSEPKDDTTPEQILQLNEKHKRLYQAIQSLKKNYRDVIILRGVKELTVTETATVLNWNENKVRVTFHRALHALQKEKERFLDEE
ncbi:RNA polymerase sigma factor [Aquibacillus sediminis]|uniref:RNA polymerase sigma factor n=1 Tax=Aquibacillus sediminis TaxID=2574734 RepID=UPI001109BD55|nr:RNA polymerase sigma factor [Aquibacillus sediminis]